MWIYDDKKVSTLDQIPKDAIGFVYCITNLSKGKMYIGKKSLYHWKKVGIKRFQELKLEGVEIRRHKNKRKSKKGLPVWVHKAKLESDWLMYTGSNAELNKHIQEGDQFEKHIWEFSNCEKKLSFLETEAQFKMDVIRDNGKYYNGNILGKYFPNDLNC
tara:strand:+ start:27866 stop:28342 length:477 start_codon:yes stop_codon:yes gene_type:complete